MDNRLKWIWPAIFDATSAENAAKQGFWAALYCCVATIILVVLASSGVQLGGFNLYALTDAFLFAVIGFGIWKKSRTAAIAGLLLYVIERIDAWMTSGPKSPVMALIITLFFIHSVRGTFALHKFKKEQTTKLQVQEITTE